MNPDTTATPPGLLGDTPVRDYSRKLRLFNACAEPELRRAVSSLALRPGMRVLDAGCGSGEALGWLAGAVGQDGFVAGMDLSEAHVAAARQCAPGNALVLQGDLRQPPFGAGSFDAIWCVNTLHHVHDPVGALRSLMKVLRPGGRIAVGQSSMLADMYFAWDARLERLVNEAVRRYYRERYELDERDLASVRAIAGQLRAAGLREVSVRTFVIERLTPLRPADERYLAEGIFRDTWGERLRPYLPADDYTRLTRLCDPDDAAYALRRPDFHFIQTFTLAAGIIAAP